jgi:hypothetical protein
MLLIHIFKKNRKSCVHFLVIVQGNNTVQIGQLELSHKTFEYVIRTCTPKSFNQSTS